MLKDFVGAFWKHIPGRLRRCLVRLGQGRFTVTAGALIFDDAGRLLLLEHVFRPDSGWGIPGGFMTGREQPEEALRRELREEVGLEIEDVEFLLARNLRKPRQIEIYFLARPAGTAKPCSFEIKRAEWFKLEDLPDGLSNDQRRLIKRALALKGAVGDRSFSDGDKRANEVCYATQNQVMSDE